MFFASIMGSGATPHGRWRPDHNNFTLSFMGSQVIDFSQAAFDEGETRLSGLVSMGSMRIIVPPYIDVSVDGADIMGSRRIDVYPALETSSQQRLRITVVTLMGSLRVESARE